MAGLCEGGNEPPGSLKASKYESEPPGKGAATAATRPIRGDESTSPLVTDIDVAPPSAPSPRRTLCRLSNDDQCTRKHEGRSVFNIRYFHRGRFSVYIYNGERDGRWAAGGGEVEGCARKWSLRPEHDLCDLERCKCLFIVREDEVCGVIKTSKWPHLADGAGSPRAVVSSGATMYPFPVGTVPAHSLTTPHYYQSMLKSFPAPVFNSSPAMTSPFLMDNLLNSKFEHSQPGSGEGAAPRKLLERDSRALLVPPKNPATSAPYFNGGASPRQGQLDPGTGLLSPHPADGLGPTATASLTLGITASYSIVAQDPHARHPPAAVVTCACGASDDCKLGYYHGGQGAGCCCYERRGEAPRKQDTAPSPTKPILKFSVSAILGADSVKTPPCTGNGQPT
ncbi:hypothetical protein ANN_07427 [Periplaneta americana]|uniref:Uncharacterized protein n=1 Tax=Periplaneta americana TaxID=6978 RepID=A0ABQ8T0V0_PERAM|nr:hypothetical protein ANN_07427 [Periplaneta americana]